MLKVEMGIVSKLMISRIDCVLLSTALTFVRAGNPIDSVNACTTESYFQKVQ